jgi:hypothetical protein
MSNPGTPKNGDFASYIESLSQQAHTSQEGESVHSTPESKTVVSEVLPQKEMQTLEDVLSGEEPDEEFLEQIAVLHEVPRLSDEELERQALAHPGADGDPNTPE